MVGGKLVKDSEEYRSGHEKSISGTKLVATIKGG
jgi:hypothetical protein